MLKKIQKKVEDLRVKVYAGQTLEDTEKALYEIDQMLFKAMDDQSNVHVVNQQRELLLDFADYSESDKTSQTTDECVDNYLDSIK